MIPAFITASITLTFIGVFICPIIAIVLAFLVKKAAHIALAFGVMFTLYGVIGLAGAVGIQLFE